jgi:hypothetical protein
VARDRRRAAVPGVGVGFAIAAAAFGAAAITNSRLART